MTGGAGREWGVGRRLAAAATLFVLASAVYAPGRVSQGYNLADPLLIVPTAVSMLQDRDLELGEFASEVDSSFYGLLRLEGRPYNRYPIGSSLVILPLVWIAGPPASGETPLAHSLRIAAPIAKVVAALSVALLFLLLVEVTGHPGRSVALALVFAFATPHYPTHAGGLWTHNAVTPVVLVAFLLVVVRDGRFVAFASLPLALAFATRPTTLPAIVGLTGYVAWRFPRAFPAYATMGAASAALFGAWSWYMYWTVLPPYYLGFHGSKAGRIAPMLSLEALLGNVVSPNRGLLVFAPVFLFSLWGMVRVFRSDGPYASLYRTIVLIVAAHWVMISTIQEGWWGGWSFGPRNFMDVLPLFVLLLSPALDGFAVASGRTRGLARSAGAVALAWSFFVAVHGATSFAPHRWNRTPVSVNKVPARIWDWSDMQVLRGIGWTTATGSARPHDA